MSHNLRVLPPELVIEILHYLPTHLLLHSQLIIIWKSMDKYEGQEGTEIIRSIAMSRMILPFCDESQELTTLIELIPKIISLFRANISNAGNYLDEFRVPKQFHYIFKNKLLVLDESSNILERFKEKKWKIHELRVISEFIARFNFLVLLCDSKQETSHVTIRKQLKHMKPLEFSWLYQPENPLVTRSFLHRFLRDEEFNTTKPIRIRGFIFVTNKQVKVRIYRFVIPKESRVIPISPLLLRSFTDFCCKPNQVPNMETEFIMQQYWFPGFIDDSQIINNTNSQFQVSYMLKLCRTSTVCNTLTSYVDSSKYLTMSTINEANMVCRPSRNHVSVAIPPRPFAALAALASVLGIFYFVWEMDWVVRWKLSRDFFNRAGIKSWVMRGLLIGMDMFHVLGYPFKALITWNWGCFREQHVTLAETWLNLLLYGFAWQQLSFACSCLYLPVHLESSLIIETEEEKRSTKLD